MEIDERVNHTNGSIEFVLRTDRAQWMLSDQFEVAILLSSVNMGER